MGFYSRGDPYMYYMNEEERDEARVKYYLWKHGVEEKEKSEEEEEDEHV